MSQPRGFKSSESLAAIADIETEVGRLTCGLSEAQFHAPGPAGGWSIGFCLEHLTLTAQAFLPVWELALRNAQAEGNGHHQHPYWWWQRTLLAAMAPPYKIKTKASQSVMPSTRRSIDETLRRLSSMHREITRRIELTDAKGACGIKVHSPFVPWLSYPLGFSFDLALAHERRHIWQAWQVRSQYVD